MYWQSNFDAVQSLMREASEHGSPAYLLTVRGSVHISQSDFSVLYKHVSSFFLKATVHPYRAIDLNISYVSVFQCILALSIYSHSFCSASLEFLRLVTPESGSGKAIIDRCMNDESILQTQPLDDVPDDHRPDDEWIAARLRVHHEFRRRVAAGVQRKFKRNFQGGMGTGYTTSDEVWCHFKPTDDQLERWINEENRGDERIQEQSATYDETTSLSDADETQRNDTSLRKNSTRTGNGQKNHDESVLEAPESKVGDDVLSPRSPHATVAAAGDASNDAPTSTWLGMLPALRDGPQKDRN